MSLVEFDPIQPYFPMEKARPPQVKALSFIQSAVAEGYADIVIAAPTGVGKTGIGMAVALWGATFDVIGHVPGGYYLVTQKMLQDQLENDFPKFKPGFKTKSASLKSSTEYPCRQYGTCMAGSMASKGDKKGQPKLNKTCFQRIEKTCPYLTSRTKFELADVGVTNYPYLFTEHLHVNELPPRNFLIGDECHTLEKQITGFIEVLVNKESLDNWAPGCRPVPEMSGVLEFAEWLQKRYLVMCSERLDMLHENLQASGYTNRKMQDEFNKLKNHTGRLAYAVANMAARETEWIFWQDMVEGEWQCTAKPLSAAPFVPGLVDEMGNTRIYMSAYPGPKSVFCRSLGLDPENVAWLELDSPFPVENRLIHMTPVGSMSRKSIDATLPGVLRMCETILEAHPEEKGIIHSNSYVIGQKIYEYLLSTGQGARVLFATKASERAAHFNTHRTSKEPTVMLSPSIAEGFSFDDDLARFQIIAKVPFPYLGDRQVAARMERDREWYTLQTVMTILQACGRIVRSETDHGSTYILDHDFSRLYSDNTKFFPAWFKSAFKFY